MGCTNAKITSYRDGVLTFKTEKEKSYYKTLKPYLDLNNFNNVNKIYSFMIDLHID